MVYTFSNHWKPMRITGETRVFAVFGHPIGHSLSPAMHNAAFAALAMDAVYTAFDVRPEALRDALTAARVLGFGGLNLTVPLKELALPLLDRLDDSARLLGAANTVALSAGGLVGHNTDGAGFLEAAEEAFDGAPRGRAVLVLGAGGAGRAVALSCAQAGARAITLVDTDAARAQRVAAEIAARFPGAAAGVAPPPGEEAARAADWVVQATPVGMRPEDPSLLAPAAFRAGQCVFDLVYMYPETRLMAAARRAGARTANGLGMLLHQGMDAFRVWTGVTPPRAVMQAALEKAVAAHA